MTHADALVINVLRAVYIATLIVVSMATAKRAYRAWTSRIQPGDFDIMLFCLMAVNRIWFVGRSLSFDDHRYLPWEAESLVACYVFAIGLEWAVLGSRKWRGG